MDSLHQPAAKRQPTEYEQRAQATRKRRQAAGRYATPSQKAALRRYVAGGLKALLPGDDELIAGHPHMGSFSVNWGVR